MRKGKRVMLYSMLVCFAFFVAVVVSVAVRLNKPVVVDEDAIQYDISVEGPARIEFSYVPGTSSKASYNKIYEYGFGNTMQHPLRIMLAVDEEEVQQNVTIGYYVANNKTIINEMSFILL